MKETTKMKRQVKVLGMKAVIDAITGEQIREGEWSANCQEAVEWAVEQGYEVISSCEATRAPKQRGTKQMTKSNTRNKWTTASNLTGAQINALRNEAGAAGDLATVKLCDRAINGSKRAYAAIAKIIRNAEAMA